MRTGWIGLLLAVALSGASSTAAAWPDGPVRIVVPYAAGGSTDVVARVVAARLQTRLGQPVIIENVAGSAGNNGAAVVARSQPDGYTLLMATPGPAAMNQFMYRKMPFDTASAFTPVVYVAFFPSVLVVSPKVKATTLEDFIAEMKALPQGANYGSAGVGSTGHLGGTLFVSSTGLTGTHVPYRGSAPMLQDLLAGNIDFTVDTVPGVMSFITSGTLKALAIAGKDRAPAIPDIPNNAEAGIPDVEMSSWLAFLAPAGTPRAVVERVNAEVNVAIKEPALAQRIFELGAVPTGGTPEDLAAFLKRESTKWKRVIETAGIRID
ncbi:MAG: tripartite tricarboxylate transporter substrate binding protein [Rhodoplanes sp.]|uniref:Bug family tripartite tricarboxylate transporter substrate binding protein n=1 Tax=Rhodoplanes sp. TaxID=1968906 RepID=UPI00181EB492|nr:tripartite tricarboxylate transporter substrate binding protein [Rhodoplanes sp.]NVO16919.1 tripartite tricarboxylate transporter substrate binding protein [Rhodoplanes sp.]